jgi:pyruvate,orthophosphate dikinase
VRIETSPEDIRGMIAAEGILTARGGMTSHAAVVSRGMGKPCVAGCSAALVDYAKNQCTIGGRVIKEGDIITLDGAVGEVILGNVPRIPPTFSGPVTTLLAWADERRRMGVRTNADTPHDARQGREFGAEGIGLCRTEHMFFEADRIDRVREAILADSPEARRRPLEALLQVQRSDFIGIFNAMDGLPVTIRLLDPPLHEFLPHEKADIDALAERIGWEASALHAKIEMMHEFNPMLGHRGVRLGITFPDIYRMQVRAILEAALHCTAEGIDVQPEIMVPLVATKAELAAVKVETEKVAEDVFSAAGRTVDYLYGTMIELPRACVVADKIAECAEFFSFGTNDLTQTTFGLSRDDAGTFLPEYVSTGILQRDPFVAIDLEGVGVMMELAVSRGRQTNPDIKLGICGEHGGEPTSVTFCNSLGLDYVSCSPYRVPVARLAAAQAALREQK